MSDTGREAKFYHLTRAGQAHMDRQHASWRRLTKAIGMILKTAEGGTA
jgi:PadR family transcriptional regulator, regulatory protein PadR